jgi:membrane protease YdiL (CAAX protease family)
MTDTGNRPDRPSVQTLNTLMTLATAVVPLTAYTIAFQTIVYLALPRRMRTMVAPVVTGAVGAALVVVAGTLFGFDTIGLAPFADPTALFWGLATVLVMSLIGTVMLSKPGLRTQLADPRIAALSPAKAFGQIFVRIPVFTALIEEAFFRGVLHAALMALFPTTAAIWLGAGLFGLWHIGPGIDQAQANDKSMLAGTMHTAVTVIATTVAGLFLVWLRVETGSIWAPFAVHAAINMTMALFARAAGRRSPASA